MIIIFIKKYYINKAVQTIDGEILKLKQPTSVRGEDLEDWLNFVSDKVKKIFLIGLIVL